MSVAGVEEEIKVPDSAGKWSFYGVCLYRQGVIGTYMIIAWYSSKIYSVFRRTDSMLCTA